MHRQIPIDDVHRAPRLIGLLRRFNFIPYLFLIPALILVTAVSLYPILYAIRLSFYDTHYLDIVRFVGFKHYISIFNTTEGRLNIIHSLTYVFGSQIIILPLGLGLALLLNRPIRFQRIFRVIIVMPWVVSQTIAALLWKWCLNPYYGSIQEIVAIFTGQKIDLFSYPNSAMFTLIIVNVWLGYPYAVVLLLAALQTVSQELYDAASVDGASSLVRLFQITIPLIRPTILVTTILMTLLFLNMVTLILVLTGGGPMSSTEVLSLRAFKEAFQFWRMGLGAAFSVVMFLFNIIFSLWYIRLIKTEIYA